MHASFVPAPPPPPEPPAVLRAMTRPELTGRSGPIGGPPNPPLLSCPRRGPGSASAGHPHPPVPRAPPDAPTNQQLYGVSRHQPPPPASAPPQAGVGLLPIPTGNTFTCSRRGPPPPPPFSEREERESDAFATRASGAVGIRTVRLPESHPAARGTYPQTEVLHISRRHSAHETANCLDLSHRGDADPAETPQMSHGDPPPPVSSRERQDNAQNLDGFRHLHRQHADYSYEDAGFCDHDRLRGPRDFSLPQEPREAFNREPRQGREQSPVVLVLQSRHGDRGDSRQWPPERTDQRQYETDKDLEKGAYRAVLKDRPDSPGRRSRMDDERNSSEYSPRECVPADFSRATAGGTLSEPQIPRWQSRELDQRSYSPHGPSRSGAPMAPPVQCSAPKGKTLVSLSCNPAYEQQRLRKHPPRLCTRRCSPAPPTGHRLPLPRVASFSREVESLAASYSPLSQHHIDSSAPCRRASIPLEPFSRAASPSPVKWQSAAPASLRRTEHRRPCLVESVSCSRNDTVRRSRCLSPKPPIPSEREHWAKYRRFSDSSGRSTRTPPSQFRGDASPSQRSNSAWNDRSFTQSPSCRVSSQSPRRLPVPTILSAPSTSSQCASRQLPPLRVNSASAADWRRFPSSESPSRIFREMPRRFEGADTPRRSRGLSSPRHSGFPWHQPPSQLTPSPCSQALSRLPPSPITPFGVAGPQRSPGGAPPLPVERRSPQNSGSLDDRRLGGSDGQRGEGKKRSRDFPQDDVSPLQPAAPPVVLTVRGGLSHSRSGLEVEAGRPESRPATERQRRRKQRQQQRRQRARRRQQNQQESCTGGSSVRESPRDNHSVCGQDEEPERSSRGNQTVTATSSLPLMVRRASNLSESTDSDQEAERATGEERQQDNDDPWAASLEDIEQHLKKRKTTDFDVAAKSAHFPERADATAAIDFPAGCQVPPNCDELFLPPWRERQKSSNGRVVYQFELLQQGHLAAPWHRLTGASSPDGHRISQHAVVAKCSSRHSQNPHSFGRGRQEPSVGRGREPRFESQMVSSVDGECNPPKDSYPPASCTDGDHGRADDTIYDSGLAARGPGSSCSSNSSRRTSMSTCHNQEQWGTEHTRGSENSDTCFWTNERVQRSLLTPSTRAPTEGEGNQDSRFHAGVNYEECEAQKDESFRRESDTIRPTRCYDAAQEGWWSDWTIQLKRRENRVHEKDGHSNMMLPPVQWC
ncbi:hypothetical protein TGCAST_205050 [Toxoplasma gondii CAST]|uniref:Uncharacterized protein n=1 Tax=Toxoplasma gondii CAST TaxID=943122 RepID=A0A425I2U0_TOXGO|nr:hypothetical protein TGCAST_205050 [Toxoplasma gondii CAST]